MDQVELDQEDMGLVLVLARVELVQVVLVVVLELADKETPLELGMEASELGDWDPEVQVRGLEDLEQAKVLEPAKEMDTDLEEATVVLLVVCTLELEGRGQARNLPKQEQEAH